MRTIGGKAACFAVAALCASAAPAAAQDGASTLRALEETIQKAAARIEPSIVLIYVERSAPERPLTTAEMRRLGLLQQQPAEGYYSRPDGPAVGVVADDKGTVLTSAYNLAGQVERVWVVGSDGRKRTAKVLGRDPNLDVQALKVEDASGLVPAPRGDSAAITPGRMVVLVARSEGAAAPTVNFGVVSAVGRLRGQALQVSTRMNYGNNGGAVVDLSGRLVGVAAHHSNQTMTGQNSGVGFAAPVHLVAKVEARLLKGESIPIIPQPFMGIQGSREQPEGSVGVQITRVLEGTAAAGAGLKANDIIKIFNGVEVNDFLTLAEEIQKLSVGDEIIVTVVREGWEKDFTIKLGARPEGQ